MSLFDRLRTQKLLSFTLMLFTLSVGIVIGTLVNSGVKAARDSSAAPDASPLVIPSPVELSNTFSQIAKQVEPSVVNISTTYNSRPSRASNNNRRGRAVPQDGDEDGNGMDDFFRFFGNPFGGGGNPGMQQPRGSATGSGVVVDRNGYILTNNHVVDKADRVQVKFPGDAHQYDAKVIGTDSATDLAVIRVEGKSSLVPAKIGNSDAVQVGDWAMAIGSPFGFQTTVTAGIISAKEREIPGDSSQFQHFLQTDAAINPGNSGGPLLNIRGEVIGINTAIISRSGGFQGLGFALPINAAAGVYNDIIKTGRVTRGSIGIRFTQTDSEQSRALLKAYGLTDGIFVQSVTAGGPAEKGGLREGDVIVAINGKPVKEGSDLIGTVTSTPVGTALNITAMRDKKRESFKVVVGDLAQVFPDQFGNGSESARNNTHGDAASFGMFVQTLTDRQRQSMNLADRGGVLITQVEPNSFAEDVGLHEGDVLVSINSQPVNTREDVVRIRGTLKPGAAVAFKVMSRGGRNSGDWTSAFLAGTMPSGAQ